MCARASSKSQRSDADIWRDPWGIPISRRNRAPRPSRRWGSRMRVIALADGGAASARDWPLRRMGGKARAHGDILARQVDSRALRSAISLRSAQEARAMLEPTPRGVNAFIATGYRPIEYSLLKSRAGEWLPWHSIAVMRQIGFLMGSVWWKLWRAALCRSSGPKASPSSASRTGAANCFAAAGPREGPVSRGARGPSAGVAALLEVAPHDVAAAAATIGRSRRAAPRRDVRCWRAIPIACSRCRTCTDRSHLACDEFDVIGLTVPGVPGFPHFGHNEPRRLVRDARLCRYPRSFRRALLRRRRAARCSRMHWEPVRRGGRKLR